MSILLKQYESVSESEAPSRNIQISEGDWAAYQHETDQCRINLLNRQAPDEVTSYKRDCAFAYLGRRAQKNGGICNRSQPRIFTDNAIADLGKANAAARYHRYPWLGTLLKLLADIELIQDDITLQSNVISLSVNHTYPGLANLSKIPPVPKKTSFFSFDAPTRA